MPRFPPRGPHGRLFPRFAGTIKALRLPAVPPAAFSLPSRDRTTGPRLVSLPPSRRVAAAGLGLFARYPRPGVLPWRRQATPKFLGNPDSRLRMSTATPVGRDIPDRLRNARVAPAMCSTKAPAMSQFRSSIAWLSGLLSTYHGWVALSRARLASRCWSGSPGRAFHPQGSVERFLTHFMWVILLSQASWHKHTLARFQKTRGRE